MTTSQFVTQ